VSYYGEGAPLPAGTVLVVDFSLDGEDFTDIKGGEHFEFSESVSFRVVCHGQEEVDHYWNALSNGGSEGRCGWLKDKFVVSWHVPPVEMGSYLGHADPQKAQKAMAAMLQMSKIDLAAFEAALHSSSVD
jgi:predicted 3-demethylubiquinone-9 3-methyltransferase (glyoxalase superfamily)